MLQQSTSHVVMVRPDHFGFNSQTAETNPFMHTPESLHTDTHDVRSLAQYEFEEFVATLQQHDITVHVLPSRTDAVTPDAVFPNNWFTHHSDGRLVLYPMLTPNRRLERQKEALVGLLKKDGISVSEVINLASDEEDGHILEGTGSLVLDRVHKVAFAMASARTTRDEFNKWCELLGYTGMYIVTPKYHRNEVYHTNLLMSIGTDFAVACLEVIEDEAEQRLVKEKLVSLGKEVIEISLEQVYGFCGNILEVQSQDGTKKIVMSETAKSNYTQVQLDHLEQHGEIITVSIPTIEEIGGGGARCMLAEVFV